MTLVSKILPVRHSTTITLCFCALCSSALRSRGVFAESEQEPLTVYDGVHLSPTGISEPSDDSESDMTCFSEMVRDYLSGNATSHAFPHAVNRMR